MIDSTATSPTRPSRPISTRSSPRAGGGRRRRAGHPRSRKRVRSGAGGDESAAAGRRSAVRSACIRTRRTVFAGDPDRAGDTGSRAVRADAVGPRRRRNRPRLPLRLLAARRPAGGLPGAAARRPRARSAGRDPHARSGGRHDRDSAGRGRRRSCAASCTVSPGTDALADAGARARVLHFAGRHRHVSEGAMRCGRPRGASRIDRLLTETDSPFLAPVPHRGKRNEPAYVAAVVATRSRRCTG